MIIYSIYIFIKIEMKLFDNIFVCINKEFLRLRNVKFATAYEIDHWGKPNILFWSKSDFSPKM